jgi:fumarate reductase subunit D
MKQHPSYWTFFVHRASGIALAVFLPIHFWVLGDALHLDGFLAWSERPLVKLGEWAIVVALAAHLGGGLRVPPRRRSRSASASRSRWRCRIGTRRTT